MQKILFYDLETYPTLAYTWSLFKPVIGYNQIVEPSRIACISYQWAHEKKVRFISEHHNSRKEMLDEIWRLFDEADVVVGYNNRWFDDKWVSSELILEGYQPPSPSKTLDLYQIIKSSTQFPSKKLAYVAPTLVDDTKVTHSGFDLWLGCMNNDEKAWNQMKRYAVQDTKLLKPLYEKLKPWIKTHPVDHGHVGCPRCGSCDFQKRGFYETNASRFQRFRCSDCGGWFREKRSISTTEFRPI